MPILGSLRKRYSSMSSFLWKADGSTAEKAATSALAIKALTGTNTDGNYWIKDNNGVARQLYCIMSVGGGGWMRMNANTVNTFNIINGSGSWNGDIRNFNFYNNDGSCDRSAHRQYNISFKYPYTEMIVIYTRVSSVGQCMLWTGQTDCGYYTTASYTGAYTSSGMCTWGDSIWAYGTGNLSISGLQNKWVVKVSGLNGFSTEAQMACAAESGSAQEEFWVR